MLWFIAAAKENNNFPRAWQNAEKYAHVCILLFLIDLHTWQKNPDGMKMCTVFGPQPTVDVKKKKIYMGIKSIHWERFL